MDSDHSPLSPDLSLGASGALPGILSGAAAAESLQGTDGSDSIDGGGGADWLAGGPGADTYVYRPGYGPVVIDDHDGQTIVRIEGAVSLADLNLVTMADGLRLAVGNGSDAIVLRGLTFADQFRLMLGDQEVAIADLLLAQARRAGASVEGRIDGTAGDDQLEGGPGADLLAGNGGSDQLVGGLGDDSYLVTSGVVRIVDSGGHDRIRVDGAYSPADLAFATAPDGRLQILLGGTALRVDLPNRIDVDTGAAPVAPGDIEEIVFADGTVVDLTAGQRILGGDGNDVLFAFGATPVTLRPGAGNDHVFALNGRHDLHLEAGFGHDVFHFRQDGTITFAGMALDSQAAFARRGFDLVVTLGGGADSLTIKDAFAPLGIVRNPLLVFSGASITLDQVVSRLAVATAGDDTLWGRVELDGGAGNDALVGSAEANGYVFARGYGHDVIKEQEGPAGALSADDVAVLSGLTLADVTFARAAHDPLSIVMTIRDTGETLTFDGTPFDDFAFAGEDRAAIARTSAHGVDRLAFADGSVISLVAIVQSILDAENTSGADRLESFGASVGGATGPVVLDGGAGNDIYLNRISEVAVRLAAGTGSDRLINRNSGPTMVTVSLGGLAAADLLVLFEQRQGQAVTVLRARSGEELVIDGRPGSAGLAIRVVDESGAAHGVRAEGALIGGQAASDAADYLTGTSLTDDIFHPGKGNDVIAGQGGNDTLVFNPGDGADRLLRPDDAPGTYTVQLGAGFLPSDLSWSWLNDGSNAVRLSFNAVGDSITVDARQAGTLAFADGTLLRVGDWAGPVVLAPGDRVEANAGSDDSFVASFGGVQLAMGNGSGTDRFRDAGLVDAHGTLVQPPAGWQASTLLLEGGTSIDDFEFVQDSSAPANLVVRNLRTGASLVVEGQFANEILLRDHGAWLSPDSDGDGAPDWATLDLDGDGSADFTRLDSDGDGLPDWDKADFDGDGRSDWQSFTLLTLDADGDGTADVYAHDGNGDGLVDSYDFVLNPTASRPDATGITFRDGDGDGQVDEYSTDYVTFIPLPRDAGGQIAWGMIDTNQDGLADTAALDSDGDGIPDWQMPDRNGDGRSDWRNESVADLYDPLGQYVATRIYSERGEAIYVVDGSSGLILARDSDGDGIPETVARDADGDFRPDPIAPFHPVETLRLMLQNPDGTVTATMLGWSEIANRLVTRDEGSGKVATAIDLFAARPSATPGEDVLVARSGETVDGLAGNDAIHALEGGATIRFGRGSGNDTVFADTSQGARPNAVVLGNILSPAEIEVLRSPGEPADLVIRIRNTGEELRIAGQWREAPDGSTHALVETFTFAGGEQLSQAQMLTLVSGAYLAGDDSLASGPRGGLLDGGPGADQLDGGSGDDVYRFGRGYGADRIADAGGIDRVDFGPGITPADLTFARIGADDGDLRVTVAGEEHLSLTVASQFGPGPSRIESFRFADGTMLDWRDIEALLRGNQNRAPIAADLLLSGSEDAEVAIARAALLAMASDPDGDSLELSLGAARNGAVRIAEDGSIRFRPDPDFHGDAGFDYTVSDGKGGVATARVIVSLAPVNDGPVAGDDLLYRVRKNGKATVLLADLLANDSDADGDVLTIVQFGTPGHGTAMRDAQGSLVYTPKRGFSGTDSMTYTVSDGRTTATATIEIVVVGPNPYAGWRRGNPHDEQLTFDSCSDNRIFGAGGDDRITGGSQDDELAGGDGDDVLFGLGGDDFLEGNAGADVLEGGTGYDTAVFAGLKSSYAVRTAGGEVQVVDRAPREDGDDGTDSLIGVERAVFRNGGLLALAAPVVLDLDGDGVELAARGNGTGAVRFDWDGDGRADPTGWVGRDDGFLAFDRNGDGTVSNAGELSFVDDKPGARSDLDGLSAFDSNGDGMISAADEQFGGFHVWRDADGDGRVGKGEFLTLAEAGVVSIALAGRAVNRDWGLDENLVIHHGRYLSSDGSSRALADVALNYAPVSDAGAGAAAAAAADRQDRSGVRPFAGVTLDDPAAIGRAASRLAEAIAAFGAGGGTGELPDFGQFAERSEPLFAASARLSSW